MPDRDLSTHASRMRRVPEVVTFVDEDGNDLGWGEWRPTWSQRLAIAEAMTAWHQSFETTALRMIRSGLRSLKQKKVANA